MISITHQERLRIESAGLAHWPRLKTAEELAEIENYAKNKKFYEKFAGQRRPYRSKNRPVLPGEGTPYPLPADPYQPAAP
jgi:hypothetical protein